ncbi:MAG: hypothetical protein A2655_00875 [Candidatus Yanofskybacteria bacterium RIFCSPHIGHO2_01_FULL_43_42]|uniref:Uncharacterized protein n=1 Tax=Candidatus Taylorbacteria bacterium RIFCSPLOWO2_01_FULL_45_15b TaxID=1802319 RepID=A0A1G2NDM0_9BACT|nr:MAG: hypothetical protein A2655_00875 [Candidatus Yanofskybacteria bacterium RIFCSPHIGHO2_01_FULL_43_42]OHA34198.1 MAG: hypothetical protein A2928_04745 [Candidatus Taylorbacteria bacterium RIFCSPLOWO2_01_FULL_45_15b]
MNDIFDKEAKRYLKRKEELRQKAIKKRKTDEQRLAATLKRIPKLISNLLETSEGFAKYLSRAETFDEHERILSFPLPRGEAAPVKIKGTILAEFRYHERQKSFVLGREVDVEISEKIVLIEEDRQRRVGVFEYAYDGGGYEWKERQFGSETSRLARLLANPKTILHTLFEYRKP